MTLGYKNIGVNGRSRTTLPDQHCQDALSASTINRKAQQLTQAAPTSRRKIVWENGVNVRDRPRPSARPLSIKLNRLLDLSTAFLLFTDQL